MDRARPQDERMREMMARMMEARRECGPEINLAVPMYEDVTRYPLQDLIDLWGMQETMMRAETGEARAEALKAFSEKRRRIRLLPDAPERIYLWDEDNYPEQTDYTDNSDHRYDHEPSFRPYMLEMLLPADVTPVGAVVIIGGGSHGPATLNEGFQVGTEFNARGYQVFLLQCRPNHSPWNEYETGADAARALRIIRANAEKYRLEPDRIAMAGFSNGGITIDFCIEHFSGRKQVKDYFPDYRPDALDALNGGPDAYLCVYGPRHAGTPYSYDGVVYPPTFIAVGRRDLAALPNTAGLYQSLVEHNVPVEIHTFAAQGHGIAGRKLFDGVGNPSFDLWIPLADVFLQDAFGVI